MLLAPPCGGTVMPIPDHPQITTDLSDSLAQLQELLTQVSPSIGTSFDTIGAIGTCGNVSIDVVDVSIGSS